MKDYVCCANCRHWHQGGQYAGDCTGVVPIYDVAGLMHLRITRSTDHCEEFEARPCQDEAPAR